MARHSPTAVYAAIAANFGIAVTKFAAAAVTGSSAMMAEGIHSLVDTGNGGLLLLGIRKARKPADAQHPFGHGKELYFWTLIVAILIFAVGGGVSFYEGIRHLRHPVEVEDPRWAYAVLAVAAVFEGYAWTVALRELRRGRERRGIWRLVQQSKDPTTFTVLFEDTAALLGLIVAFLGLFLGQRLDNPYFDGAASVVIGLILAGVAVLLAYETKGLLIGEAVEPATLQSIRTLAEDDPAVARVIRPLTMHFGPHDVLLTMELEFEKGQSAAEAAAAVDRIDRAIRTSHPQIRHIFIEAQSLKPEARGDGRAAGGEPPTA
jgi:cation diffusion facilitator family transporter